MSHCPGGKVPWKGQCQELGFEGCETAADQQPGARGALGAVTAGTGDSAWELSSGWLKPHVGPEEVEGKEVGAVTGTTEGL